MQHPCNLAGQATCPSLHHGPTRSVKRSLFVLFSTVANNHPGGRTEYCFQLPRWCQEALWGRESSDPLPSKHEFTITGPVRRCTVNHATYKSIHYCWCNSCGTTLGHEKDTDNERIHVSGPTFEDWGSIFDSRPSITFDQGNPDGPFSFMRVVNGVRPSLRPVGKMQPLQPAANGILIVANGYIFTKAPTDP